MHPDYGAPVVKSYLDFAVKMIEETGTLKILNAVEHFGSWMAELYKYPSWVPNWTIPTISQPIPTTAFLDQSILDYSLETRSVLRTCGLDIGRIKESGETFIEFVPDIGNSVQRSPLLNWWTEALTMKRWRQWHSLAGMTKTYPTYEPVEDAYIRTLVADSISPRPGNSPDWRSMYEAWLRYWRLVGPQRGLFLEFYTATVSAQEAQRATSFMRAHQAAAYGRRFFVMCEGYFGLGPHETQRGDHVVALCGGQTLYVLRPRGGRTTHRTWRVMGECYVHGVPRNILSTHSGPYVTFRLH